MLVRDRIRRNARRRGFTLTELMVSLVMGLIVALAAVGLARNATSTFHEQARSSTTEMSLRIASDRLRQDLARVSYMSTGNLPLDPKVARLQTASTPAAIARYSELTELRGVKVDVNMQAVLAATSVGIPATLAVNGISPDAIELVGNYTTDDAYTGSIADVAAAPSPDGSCTNGMTITLDTASDAATYTLGAGVGGTVDPAILRANAMSAFMPVTKKRFLAQVTDAMGCTHYVPVCDVSTEGASPKPKLKVVVDGASGSRAVLFSNGTDLARNCGSSDGGQVTIAPLSRVRWRLKGMDPATTSPALLNPDVEASDKKVDLVREVMDFGGATLFTETVAEYIVDLKFGIVIDDPKATGANRQKVMDIDSDNGAGDIHRTTAAADSVVLGNAGPQHVRSIRFRLATRTSVPDRLEDLPVGGPIRARYCIEDSMTGCKKWTRVRTVTSEVALTNQAGFLY